MTDADPAEIGATYVASKNCPATQGMMTSRPRPRTSRCAPSSNRLKELPRYAGDDDSNDANTSASRTNLKELPRYAGDDDPMRLPPSDQIIHWGLKELPRYAGDDDLLHMRRFTMRTNCPQRTAPLRRG